MSGDLTELTEALMFRAAVSGALIDAVLGTEDGSHIPPESEIPAGEIARLLLAGTDAVIALLAEREAKARDDMAPFVESLIEAEKAKAWDEGRKARGLDDAANLFGQYPEHVETPNPYRRSALSGEPDE